MKTVKVNKEICGFDGKPIIDPQNAGAHVRLKDILLNSLGMHKAKDGKEAIRAFAVGKRIYDAKGDVTLEDADFELVKETLKNSQHTVVVMGQVYSELERAEDEAKNAPSNEKEVPV